MKIINESNIKEKFTVNDVQQMISNGTFGIECEMVVDNLKHACYEVKDTDKLENYLTKFFRLAPEYLEILEKATNILQQAKKKG